MWEHVEPYADRLNPDGVHWPAEAHAAVGRAVATAVAASVTASATEDLGR